MYYNHTVKYKTDLKRITENVLEIRKNQLVGNIL
jgi:hypothetical protein